MHRLLPAPFLAICIAALPLRAQAPTEPLTVPRPKAEAAATFERLGDSLAWAGARNRAFAASGKRLVVSVLDRRIWWMDGSDTLFTAPVAVGTGDTLRHAEERWEFATPRGSRRIIGKERDPVWTPPLWHYVEAARKKDREVVELSRGRGYTLHDGSRLLVRGDQVGQLRTDGIFVPVPPGEEIVFDDIHFVPPLGTRNREVGAELGAYKLDMGDGYLIHGTPHKESIGDAVTHGCVRVGDEALAYLYRVVPVGTRVVIY